MKKNLLWRALVLLLVLGGGLSYFLPTILSIGTPDGKPAGLLARFLPSKVINLGLDLKGGIYLAMEVDLQVAVNNSARRTMDDLRRRLNDADVTGFRLENESSPQTTLELGDASSMEAAEGVLRRQFADTLRIASRDGSRLVLALTDEATAEIREMTARQALETIRNRVDMFGVAEPDIRPQGEDRIIIQLPGMSDPKQAEDLIGKTAILEFKLVDNGSRTAEEAERSGPPPGTEVRYERRIDPVTKAETRIPILLRKQALMTGDSLVDSRAVRGQQFGDPQVTMTFDARGAREFDEITSRYVGRQLAIVLDNQVYSAPTIRTRIPDGEAYIEGSFTQEEARVLAVVLRAGALPAPVSVIERRTVGPSMGQDSIRQGLTAGVVGLGLVLVFMLIYYRLSGLVADLALLFNFPIVLGTLAAFGATLTLPGIFGLVLTLAMAVDANVLIFERIREEIRHGKKPGGAVKGGFNRAFWTIFDSNITTVLAAMVLYQFGSGPIRGFAVTLIIGILSSMFTAIFGSRLIFDLVLHNRPQMKAISI
ncbi:MAG: protein translocase subunit SecD [Deltaproteobacteria bacterium]|jgi:preprotein translocase subunit SecD|nr:protein translocase subunit SecD [Deltaproteobacteria bacterium]